MSDFKRINPQTASQLIASNAQLVDIRDPQSFDFGHIPGAIRLDNDNLADFVANAGGVIQLAGVYLKMTDEERERRIGDIEATTLEILRRAESCASTYAAAVAVARQRIAEGDVQLSTG